MPQLHHSLAEHEAEMTAWVARPDAASVRRPPRIGRTLRIRWVDTRPYVDGAERAR